MKKRIFLIVASIAILGSILGVSLYAGLESLGPKMNSEEREVAYPDAYIREDAKKEKTIIGINGKPEKVTYKHSQKKTEDRSYDVYEGENNVEYETDPETGKVMAYNNFEVLKTELTEDKEMVLPTNEKITIKGKVTEQQAIMIAEAEAKKMYPDEYEKFSFCMAIKQSQDKYYVEFTENWGKDGFVVARAIRVDVAQSGEIAACLMFNREAMRGVDESILDGVTYEMVENYLKEKLADELKGEALNIKRIALMQKDGRYYLHCKVLNTLKSYEYPLPEKNK